MLNHLSLGVRDLQRAIAFYDAALKPLGYARVFQSDKGAGYGPPGEDDRLTLFPVSARGLQGGPGFHLALTAPDRASVDGFHAAAVANGGTSEGEPGVRERYGPGYYAAYVRCPDGYKIEAVAHE
ncbi:MAG: VOC family protein [Myxococcales bacterium]|mgnify:CR=1 FL=1|nr:VOC family protein [Myxococcales bacterium]